MHDAFSRRWQSDNETRMAALITGGSFYQLENTGPGPMVLMGNRSGPSEDIQHINYELRKDIKTLTSEERDRIQRGGAVQMPEGWSAPGDLKPLMVARQPSSF
jgi:hypothetical protein